MKKGFTLIELLMVLVLLSIVSTIGSVTVISVIDNSRKKAILVNTESIINAFSTYKAVYRMENGNELENVTFKIENNSVVGVDFDSNVVIPESGEVNIDSNGEISIYTYDSGYCAVRGPQSNTVKIKKINQENCNYNVDFDD